jgi:hypothetical protein
MSNILEPHPLAVLFPEHPPEEVTELAVIYARRLGFGLWIAGDGSWQLWNYNPTSTADIFPGRPGLRFPFGSTLPQKGG